MKSITRVSSRYRDYEAAIASLGPGPSILYKLQKLLRPYIKIDKPYVLRSPYARFPLKCRPNTSDIDVFRQIYVIRAYRCLDEIRDAGLIIDCGANVGYSSAYFLSSFPKSYLIAIEPDPKNFSLLEINLAPYKNRYRTINSAVWSHPVGLLLSEVPFRDGREWARTVREARNGEKPTMTAIDIGTLLKASGYDRISILKIDIEGAESIVFSSNYETWIGKVDNLVIELHNEECRSIFMKAISNVNFRVSECDDLIVCNGLPN
jgi:FkbM family methyltransferase